MFDFIDESINGFVFRNFKSDYAGLIASGFVFRIFPQSMRTEAEMMLAAERNVSSTHSGKPKTLYSPALNGFVFALSHSLAMLSNDYGAIKGAAISSW